MIEPAKKNDWRLGAIIGLAIGVSMVVSKGVEKSLGPELGEWGAFGVSLIAAALAAGIVGLLAQHFIRK